MSTKVVLIIEDIKEDRLALEAKLTMRGFEVHGAANVMDARDKSRELGDRLDVVSLDMDLKDPRGVTGAHVGLEILGSRPDYPPEFLVASGKAEVVFYRLAMDLGVAAYLSKPVSPNEHVRHIRALALRRALSLSRPLATKRIKDIATQSRTSTDAVINFCRDVLAPELRSCLGAPFVIFFSDNDGTQICAGDAELPVGPNPIYGTLQALALGEGNRADPFVLESSRLGPPEDSAVEILNRLDGAAFIPLSVRDLHLSLGVLQVEASDEVPLPEDARAICRVLAQYLKPTVIDHMLSILTQWTELESRRKTILINTAQFCLYVGQEQLEILSKQDGLAAPDGTMIQELRTLAEDLRDTGGTLLHIGDKTTESSEQMSTFLLDTWNEMIGLGSKEELFQVKGECNVHVDSDDLYIVTSRLLQWFKQRWSDVPEGSRQVINANCAETNHGPQVTLEDRSRRLSKRLREELFTPFTQAVSLPLEVTKDNLPGRYLPLYLAKMLVEEKYNGVLEDHSDELPEDIGHRFVIRFPESTTAAGA